MRSRSRRLVSRRWSFRAFVAIRPTRSCSSSREICSWSRLLSSVRAQPRMLVSGVRRSCETAWRNEFCISCSARRPGGRFLLGGERLHQLGLGVLLLGHVVHHALQVERAPAVVRERLGLFVDPDDAAVLADDPVLAVHPGFAVQEPHLGVERELAVLGQDALAPQVGLARPLVGRESQDRFDLRADVASTPRPCRTRRCRRRPEGLRRGTGTWPPPPASAARFVGTRRCRPSVRSAGPGRARTAGPSTRRGPARRPARRAAPGSSRPSARSATRRRAPSRRRRGCWRSPSGAGSSRSTIDG